MTNFLEVALRNAARGFRVMPIRGKDACLKNWPQVATSDETQIRKWAAKFQGYNCGVAGGPDIAIVDSDRLSRLKELSGEHAAEWFNTYSVSSGRPDRAHFYYRMTEEVREFGNKRWAEAGIDGNIFEVKVQGGQVTAEGSTHPDTGATYRIVQDLPLLTFPAGLLALMRECYAKTNPTGKREWNLPVHDGEGRDDFLIQQAGRLRHAGASEGIIRSHLEELNSDPLIMADPKSAEDLDRIARSAARYDVPAPEPVAILGSKKPAVDAIADVGLEDAPVVERVRPVYPVDVWKGTFYVEYADLCAEGNHVPKKFFIESFRTLVGAVVGDRLASSLDGVTARLYTVLIGGPGSGKGTACDRAESFFESQWESNTTTVEPPLLYGGLEVFWRSTGIGAQYVSAASAPGLMTAMKYRRLKKGEVLETRELWKPVHRYVCIEEELRTLFSNFANESTGAGLEAILCALYDRTTFMTSATKDRAPEYGALMYSILGGLTPELWHGVFGKVGATESGFLSRLNIIGTETDKRVPNLKKPDFTPLRRRFLPLIKDLETNPRVIDPTPEASAAMEKWFFELVLPDGVQRSRLNISAWRTALHMAWLRGHDHMTPEDVEAGCRCADYQIRMREHYAPPEGVSNQARCEQTLRRVMKQHQRMKLGELKRLTNYSRWGVDLWTRSLMNMVKSGELRIEDALTPSGHPKTVILLKEKG